MADVAIVIPTIPGREADLDRCLTAYERTAPDARVHVMHGYGSCGEGWIAGAEEAGSFDYLHLTSDDLEPYDGWLEVAIETVDQGKIPAPLVYGLSGALDSAGLQGFGQYRGDYHDWMEIEATTIPFLTAEMWERIGMIPVHYATDLWVSVIGARHGWPTVVREGMRFTHHEAPAGRNYGRASADIAEYQRYVRAAA